jgi:hypothetical protein
MLQLCLHHYRRCGRSRVVADSDWNLLLLQKSRLGRAGVIRPQFELPTSKVRRRWEALPDSVLLCRHEDKVKTNSLFFRLLKFVCSLAQRRWCSLQWSTMRLFRPRIVLLCVQNTLCPRIRAMACLSIRQFLMLLLLLPCNSNSTLLLLLLSSSSSNRRSFTISLRSTRRSLSCTRPKLTMEECNETLVF